MYSDVNMVVIGTDPCSCRGGIAYALPGYFKALASVGLSFFFVPTHRANVFGGRWRFWLTAFFKLFKHVLISRVQNKKTVAYIHVGGGIPSLLRKTAISMFIKCLGVPIVLQLHGPEVSTYLSSQLGRSLFKLAILPASSLCVLTPWWKRLLKNNGIRKPVFTIPNPLSDFIESVAMEPLKGPSKNHNDIKIVAMARIEEGKGIDVIIEAIPFLPENVLVYIAGTGSLLQALKDRVVDLGVQERVDFKGWVDGTEKETLLREADIFCLPTRNDSFGMGFIEAMAHGMPVIALDWGPISDVVPQGVCGILLEDENPRILASTIASLASDKALRYEFGSNGKRWVLEEFGAKAVGEKIRNVVKSITKMNDRKY